jgi:hypothetical protein
MRYRVCGHWLLALPLLLICLGCQHTELDPTPPEPTRPLPILRPEPRFQPVHAVGEAVQEAPLITYPLPELNSHLEITTMLVAAGKSTTIPMKYEAVMELRAGSLSTSINGETRRLQGGAMWQAAKGSQMTVQACGELVVIRVIYLVPGAK